MFRDGDRVKSKANPARKGTVKGATYGLMSESYAVHWDGEEYPDLINVDEMTRIIEYAGACTCGANSTYYPYLPPGHAYHCLRLVDYEDEVP